MSTGTLNETCTDHVKGEDFFTMTAAETWSIAMVKRLKAKFPTDVEIRDTNPDGSMVVRMPFAWMRVVPKKEFSAEHREKLAQTLSRSCGTGGQGANSADQPPRHEKVPGSPSPVCGEG